MLSGDELYDDDITSGPIEDDLGPDECEACYWGRYCRRHPEGL